MVTLVENFICQHFDRIYKQICSGFCFWKGQKYGWNIEADRQQVMESIQIFFHLCLNAEKVGKEHQQIKEWIMALTKIACAQRNHGVVSSYQYRVLRNASDPITKFLFGCFDWNIYAIIPEKADYRDNRILDSFDARLKYYEEHVSYMNPEYGNTAIPLFEMKSQRNESTHTAKNFYVDRTKCLKQLADHLFNYMMVFHLIRTECYQKDSSNEKEPFTPVGLREDVKNLVQLHRFSTDISITVECVDEKSGKTVQGRAKDVLLYMINGEGKKVNCPNNGCGRFKVSFFKEYVFFIMTNGSLSKSSEKMLIDQGFFDGIVIRVNIPPIGKTPKPKKISIREIILYSEQDLPDDVKYLLDQMERYVAKDHFAQIARSLVLASATNSERDLNNYKEAVRLTRESLESEMANGKQHNIQSYMESKIEEIQKKMSEPYQKDNFKALCDSIDELYNELGVFAVTDNHGASAVEQMGKNVADFLAGKGLSIGTKGTDITLQQHKELAHLETILKMADDYPEVIEAEFGKDWLQNHIEDLYVNQINYYRNEVIPITKSVAHFYNYLKVNTDKETDEGQRVLEYAELLYEFLNDQPENIIRIVKTNYGLLSFLLDNCVAKGEEATKLKEEVRDELLNISEKRIDVPMTPIENQSEYKEIQVALSTLKENVVTLKKRIDLYHQNVESIFLQRKEKYSRFKWFFVDWRPEERKNILCEVRFACLTKITDSGVEALLQLTCNSRHSLYLLENLPDCSNLGVSPDGLCYEWAEAYTEWEKGNKEILNVCLGVISGISEKFFPKKKEREYSRLFANQNEMDDLKASRILEHQKQQIEFNYDHRVPDYIRDIINAPQSILPNHVKAQFLNKVLMPSKFPTENLLYLIDEVLRYWYYSTQEARLSFLIKYVQSGYSKLIVTPEAQSEFKSMPIDTQKLFLKILMNQSFRIGTIANSSRFLMAIKMNFPEEGKAGKTIIPAETFFLQMAKFHLKEIESYDLQEFLDACKVIKIISNYIELFPDDKETIKHAILETEHFVKVCSEYLDSHVQTVKTEEGKRPQTGPLAKLRLNKELKGKNNLEQLVIKYKDLYFCYDNNQYKLGWCEVEKELFSEMMTEIAKESPDVQEKVCNELWLPIYFKLPSHDKKAERLMAMGPFCSQKQFDKMVKDFYIICVYGDGKIEISNPSILDGLEKIRDLFVRYGQNVQVPTNGKSSTAFIEILIRIFKLFDTGILPDE